MYMPNKYNIIFQQRDLYNTKFTDRIISGSNLHIVTDAEGLLTASNAILNDSSSFLIQPDDLYGTYHRTLYARNDDITYDYAAGQNVDILSSSVNHINGSRTFSTSFFSQSVNYKAKIIQFRIVNYLTNLTSDGNSTDLSCSLYFGDQKLIHSDIGQVSLASSTSTPMEIGGELVFTNGNVQIGYSVKWCDSTHDHRKIPLSSVTEYQDISEFIEGDLKLIIHNSTDRTFNSYYGYINVM